METWRFDLVLLVSLSLLRRVLDKRPVSYILLAGDRNPGVCHYSAATPLHFINSSVQVSNFIPTHFTCSVSQLDFLIHSQAMYVYLI